MLNEYNEKNYYQEMKDRLTITFEDKPVFDKYLNYLVVHLKAHS